MYNKYKSIQFSLEDAAAQFISPVLFRPIMCCSFPPVFLFPFTSRINDPAPEKHFRPPLLLCRQNKTRGKYNILYGGKKKGKRLRYNFRSSIYSK